MPMNKPHLEFTRVDLHSGWASPPGYPAGIKQKILASDIDEKEKSGSRTRLLRIEPGAHTTAPFVHDHWEEVYLVSGDLIWAMMNAARAAKSSRRPLMPAVPLACCMVRSNPNEAACCMKSTITMRASARRNNE